MSVSLRQKRGFFLQVGTGHLQKSPLSQQGLSQWSGMIGHLQEFIRD